MALTRRVTTTVQPGGRIELTLPELPAGSEVDVVVHAVGERGISSLREILARADGHRLFSDGGEVDAFIHGERNEWPR